MLLRLVAVFRGRRADAELSREIAAHLQLLEDQYAAQGLTAADARAAARRAFGGSLESTKEQQRDARSWRVLDNWWLDARLGARMLIKHPGLSFVGGFGIAVAVAIAAGAFAIRGTLLNPTIALDEGDRLVSLQNWDVERHNQDRRLLHDFAAWRAGLTSIADVSAFRTVGRNLIAAGQSDMVRVAEMSASGFRAARVAPIAGRYLLDDDEREGAPDVVVIGSGIWRSRFSGDPAVIGRTLQLGSATHTIVGVMPESFAFPVNHRVWVPLRLEAARYAARTGPEIQVFGRLAAGTDRERAQAELSTIGRRMAAASPGTHAQLRPQVMRFTAPFLDMDDPQNALALHLVQILVLLLLVIVCVNVAILVYARTATRQAEVALRAALGASRARIVGQLFIEALVLSAAAAAAGVTIAAYGLRAVNASLGMIVPGQIPFWLTFRLSASDIVYVATLMVLSAAIVGVIPALKITGRHMPAGLRIIDGTGSGLRLGKTWTTLVVGQVAFAVALLPGAVFNAWATLRSGLVEPPPIAKEFLQAQLARDESLPLAAYRDRVAEVVRRLQAAPAAADVTFAMAAPRDEPTVWIEAEGVPTPSRTDPEDGDYAVRAGRFGHEVRFNRVASGFLAAFEVPLLAGRRFTSADAALSSDAIVVNRTFADRILGGANVLGRRIRYVGLSGDARAELAPFDRWYEIVGVVADFPAQSVELGHLVDAKVYHASLPEDLYPLRVAVRVRGGSPSAFAPTLRQITASVDPMLQLRGLLPMDEAGRQEQRALRLVATVITVVALSVVLLSAAGIYALMSLTISRRRKEIGIRAALGANPRHIVTRIFAVAAGRLAVGAVLGLVVALMLETLTNGDLMQGNAIVVMPIVALFMMFVGLLAAAGPARRGLRLDPMQTLRED